MGLSSEQHQHEGRESIPDAGRLPALCYGPGEAGRAGGVEGNLLCWLRHPSQEVQSWRSCQLCVCGGWGGGGGGTSISGMCQDLQSSGVMHVVGGTFPLILMLVVYSFVTRMEGIVQKIWNKGVFSCTSLHSSSYHKKTNKQKSSSNKKVLI